MDIIHVKRVVLDSMAKLKEAVSNKDENIFHPCTGICANVSSIASDSVPSGYTRVVMERVFVDWPLYSGDMKYPVPSPEYSPHDAYSEAGGTDRMWYSGEYAENRMKLLDFCINRLTRELKNV